MSTLNDWHRDFAERFARGHFPEVQTLDEFLKERQDWMRVGALFQKYAPECEECRFKHGENGSGWCDLGDRASEKPTDCPALMRERQERDDQLAEQEQA